jgi:hypothetical protein
MEYECASCGVNLEKGWSDSKAVEELEKNFGPGIATADCEIVCDDCYKIIMAIISN